MLRKHDYPATAADLPPAPGDLEIVKAFVNTADFEHGTDELSSPLALGKWLATWIPAYAAKQLGPAAELLIQESIISVRRCRPLIPLEGSPRSAASTTDDGKSVHQPTPSSFDT